MLRSLAIAAALCASSADAFAPSRPSTRTLASARAPQRLDLMSSAEIDSILREAETCVDGECALDEVSSLIANLQDQQSMLSKRVKEIDGLVLALESANGQGGDDRPVDEMRETVRAIFRIFALGDKASGNNYPNLTAPMGYSGETKGGGKTAYDVLPPKPIKM